MSWPNARPSILGGIWSLGVPLALRAPTRSRTHSARLIGRFGLFYGERLDAGPGMFGDVEEHAFRAVKLDLETADPVARLVHVMRAAQCFDLLRVRLVIVDQDTEIVQAGVV